MKNDDYNKWLEDSEKYFKEVQSYNTTIMTIGYATFFGILLYIKDKYQSPLIFWAALLVTISAVFFVSYEIVNNIKIALGLRKAGEIENRFFKYWASFFIPSLFCAVIGTAFLLYLLLKNL